MIADIGIYRAAAHAELLALVEATNLPCATLLMGTPSLQHHHYCRCFLFFVENPPSTTSSHRCCHPPAATRSLLPPPLLTTADIMCVGRGALDESHPNHVGLYSGEASEPATTAALVESADCLILVGANLSGAWPAAAPQHYCCSAAEPPRRPAPALHQLPQQLPPPTSSSSYCCANNNVTLPTHT